MIKRILEIDRELLVFLNNLGSELWDPIWLLITDKLTFIPIFLIIIYRFFKDFGVKQALKILLSISILILFTDQFTNFIKASFERFRPCSEPQLFGLLRDIDIGCGKYGFFSAHAANSAAVTSFILLNFKSYRKSLISMILFFWVILFSYSRIYLGKHYPSDILFGLIFGISAGYFFYRLILNFKIFVTK
jgi:undecaprenyl-diphosphatase|tara:strand:- start:807 stop:1376 length:570 start_codon:yes stop_codon:yes gene_type:complete